MPFEKAEYISASFLSLLSQTKRSSGDKGKLNYPKASQNPGCRTYTGNRE